MQLFEWLRIHDARLVIKMETELNPAQGGIEWHCEIRGFHSPSAVCPAVFILDGNGHDAVIESFSYDPGLALREAVRQLRGLKINIIYRERDEALTFPDDLTA